ncbi:MAG: Na/Pi cotransporter family protein, partial [Candidatus Muiribacteriota bacterium]
SSSACTVMIVGFMNAGLLGLRQAMSAIMGANVGTTITGQIIAFNISELAYPAIILGIILYFFFKGKKIANWGECILGFGLLFLGMTTMSNSLYPLRESELFKTFFAMFDSTPVDGVVPFSNVIGAVIIGAVLTAVVQSSSATIGLTMALAGSGLINFYTAFPLILGDNIGTTITAVLATIGGNPMAKRAGIFHSIFNITGALVMVGLLYVQIDSQPIFLNFINRITPGDVFAGEALNIERHIAMAHSFFNVSMVIILLPFINYMAKFIEWIMPVREGEIKISYLEENLLSTPELALEQGRKELLYMINVASKNVFRAYKDLIGDKKETKKEKVLRREELVDTLQEDITDYIIKLAEGYITEEQSERIAPMLHCINDAERIGDLAGKIVRAGGERKKLKINFSSMELENMKKIKNLIEKNFKELNKAFEGDGDAVKRIFKNEAEINSLTKEAVSKSSKHCVGPNCDDIRSSVLFIRAMSTFERIGDHIVNVADRIQYVSR